MPTGIGFCMGMNLEAIREVGLLDENFDKGYGEENDWCQRAIQAGYAPMQVENLFVYHKHGGSFSSEEKLQLLKSHLERLAKKHPNYNSDTADFLSERSGKNDPTVCGNTAVKSVAGCTDDCCL